MFLYSHLKLVQCSLTRDPVMIALLHSSHACRFSHVSYEGLVNAPYGRVGRPWLQNSAPHGHMVLNVGLGELRSVFDGEPGYEEVCKRFGVWETVQEQEDKAKVRADRSDSPEPDRESALWGCAACGTFNTVHNLVCSVASCMTRRPLLQKFREDKGDWFCKECNNHNRGYRVLCNWTACPTRDWVCECGNLNRSNRKFCQTRTCGRPRPFDFD